MSNAEAGEPERFFDKATNKWCFEDSQGKLFEFDPISKQWVPALETLLADQSTAYGYGTEDPAAEAAGTSSTSAVPQDVDGEIPTPEVLQQERKRKKKEQLQKAKASKKAKKDEMANRNTAIFITGLPLREPPTVSEIHQCFSKAGVILQGADSQAKIKLYYSPDNTFKGEALVVFLQEESANLAVEWFNQTELRPGYINPDTEELMNMTVARAQFTDKPQAASSNANGTNVSKGKKKQASDPEKAKAQKQAEKLKKKLEGWESDNELEAKAQAAARQTKSEKVVVLKHMFSLQELEKDPTLLLELKEDVRTECESLGRVTNVVLFDLEAEGIMTVRFQEELAARACIQKMNGRSFAGRKVEAFFPDNKIKYRKSGKGDEVDEGEKARLDAFAQYLEGQNSSTEQSTN